MQLHLVGVGYVRLARCRPRHGCAQRRLLRAARPAEHGNGGVRVVGQAPPAASKAAATSLPCESSVKFLLFFYPPWKSWNRVNCRLDEIGNPDDPRRSPELGGSQIGLGVTKPLQMGPHPVEIARAPTRYRHR